MGVHSANADEAAKGDGASAQPRKAGVDGRRREGGRRRLLIYIFLLQTHERTMFGTGRAEEEAESGKEKMLEEAICCREERVIVPS